MIEKVSTKIKRVFTTTASVIVIVALVFSFMGTLGQYNSYASDDENSRWAITVGNKPVLYVESESAGQQVITGLKNYYLSEGFTLMAISIEPEIEVKNVTTMDAMEESIANENLNLKSLKTVDVDEAISYINSNNLVNVKTVERVTTLKSIDYKTVYKKSSKVRKTTSKVSTKGSVGTEQFVNQVTKVNGVKTNSELISTETTKEAICKVVVNGTGSVKAKKGKTISGTKGSDVIAYAKKFVGNPYVYGGTSLTKGCDCSGFVQSIYKYFGVKVPRTLQTSVGKSVKLKNIKPGDIVRYSYGHMAIYVGNGKVIHAINERVGIKITKLNYTGKVVKVSRIFN